MSAKPQRTGLAVLLLAAILLTGCLEQLSTTRIPAGAARNFFYFLVHNEQADANTYWAPDHAPADSAAQVARAAAALRGYDVEVLKADTSAQPADAPVVTLSGRAHRKTDPATPTADSQPLLRAHLIMIGPGWRLTGFELLCCTVP